MKIVLLNAATLPIYRDELTPLLLEADTSDSAPEAEAFFHELRAALSRNQRLLWIARDEHGVIRTVQLDLDAEKPSDQCGTVSTLVVDSTARRRGVGKQLMRELENTAFTLRRGLLSLDIEAGTPAEAFYRAQGYVARENAPQTIRNLTLRGRVKWFITKSRYQCPLATRVCELENITLY